MASSTNRFSLVVSVALLSACASSQSDAGPAEGGETGGRRLPFADIPMGVKAFNVAEAESVVRRIEAEWPKPEDDSLLNPSSLEDALQILKLDQVNLFKGAVDYVKEVDTLEAKALRAQIELAWGESYVVLMEILLHLERHIDKAMMKAQMQDYPTATEKATLQRLDILSQRIARVIQLFQVLSLEHTSKGSELAYDVMNNYPESYLGYRLSADHRRMTRDWKKFDLMVSKIETTNPDSNGLIFLRAAAALQRDADRDTAEELYRQALANDPQFVRAQAHLVMAQPELSGIIREYQKLKRINPNHQVIRWLDAALGLAYAETR